MDPKDKGKAAAKSKEQMSPRFKEIASTLTPLRIPVQKQASPSSSSSPSSQIVSPLDSFRLRDSESSSLSTMQLIYAMESPKKRMLREQATSASSSPTKETVPRRESFSPQRAPYSRPHVLPLSDHEQQHYEHVHHNENEHNDEEDEQEEDAQGHNWYSPTCLVIAGAILAFFIAFIVWFIVTSVRVLKHHHHHSAF